MIDSNFIYEIDDNEVAYFTLDLQGEKANILKQSFMIELDKKFDEILQDTPKAVVFKSAKKSIFIAGADINEIKNITDRNQAKEKVALGQEVISKISRFSCPTIAMINGACLGGGLEFVLACDYRICCDEKAVKLGLPEVKLGIIPGFGGTQRLMRLVGFSQALKLITSGSFIDSKKAYKIGLVDFVYAQAYQDSSLQEFLGKAITGKIIRKKAKLFIRVFEKMKFLRQILVNYVVKEIKKKSKGFYPAPLSALAVMHQTYNESLEKGLEVECEAFADLAISSVSKSLINVYQINEANKKNDFDVNDVLTINSTGVVGAGIMGGGIAWLFSNLNLIVRLKDVAWEPISKGMQQVAKNYDFLFKRKKYTKSEVDNKLSKINYSTTFEGFEFVDLVIEAVPEDMDLKKKVLSEIESKLKDKAILASNTSSLSVDEMATALKRPANFIGMHFFNPVNRMPLVEVIAAQKTDKNVLNSTVNFAKKCGKIPIIVKNSPGFVVNRILMPYINEAGFLLQEGNRAEEIDYALTKFGMPMGGLTLLDEVGIDVGYKVCKTLNEAFGERMVMCPLFDKLYNEKKLLGKKANKGIYTYTGKKVVFNNEISVYLKEQQASPEDVIIDRCIMIMINEASRCLEEQVIASAGELDLAMIMGTGFPPFRGGLIYYADSLGIDKVYEKLTSFATKYGERFAPSALIIKLYEDKKKFYEREEV